MLGLEAKRESEDRTIEGGVREPIQWEGEAPAEPGFCGVDYARRNTPVGIAHPREIRLGRSLALPGGGLFLADWDDVVFVHYAIDPGILQPHVPFELDCHEGLAYVSLVAFTQRRLRPRFGGKLAAMVSTPLASHPFLNVRTYVRHQGERGIYFLSEWIPNRLATLIGPPLYGLPYRLGRLRYRYDRDAGEARHEVAAARRIIFDATFDPCRTPQVCAPGSLDAFLLERYTAFTHRGRQSMCFRVSHAPWLRRPAKINIHEADLLDETGILLSQTRPIGGNYSEGVKDVGLSAPLSLLTP